MASTSVIPLPIPGLHTAPALLDLQESTKAYVSPKDTSTFLLTHILAITVSQTTVISPRFPKATFKTLRGFSKKKYNVQSKFGLHLIHGHLTLQEGTVMLGQAIHKPLGCWTKPINIHEIDLNNVHGHIFRLVADNRLVAYEYRNGTPIDMKNVGPDFLCDFIAYLKAYKLENLLGLQAVCDVSGPRMLEFVLGETGTVMLGENSAKHGGIYRTTGWYLGEHDGEGRFVELDVHSKTTKSTHQVFVSKELSDLDSLTQLLRDEDIIQTQLE